MDTVTVMDFRRRVGEVLDRAMRGWATTITRHGRAVAIVIGADEYARLRAAKEQYASVPRPD